MTFQWHLRDELTSTAALMVQTYHLVLDITIYESKADEYRQ